MRSFRAEHNLIAVSANLRETALNTEQTLDTTLLVDRDSILQLSPRREDNRDEQTGKEEPDRAYNLGALSETTLTFSKAKPQDFAFGYAFALGTCSPSAWGTGYKHVITPTEEMCNPSFTAAGRLGQTVMKRRFASFLVDQLTATFAKDSWAKLSLSVKGTGKYTDNVTKETVTAAYNAMELTLAANAVQGATAAARLDSIHAVRVLVPTTGEYKDVAITAASSATPAVLTITAPGEEATSTSYEILYAPTEPAWCSFPARVDESPLRVTDLVVKVGGLWNGTTFLEGHSMSEEIESIEHVISNEMAVEFRPGGTGAYASYAYRQRRIQTLKLDRQFRDFIMQRKILDNEYFGVQMKATGAEFETGKNFYVDVVFPRCVVLTAPLKVNGNFVGEEGDLQVLEDDTYGSVRVEVANKVSGYAQ
ncbi:MAG: hypothetical protein GXX82_16540 [Syntrophorhabdus sp.]|nr:hypothetical protein [Syntrophorhabdus sp.]